MIYKVFLDTNIYDGANYLFRNSQFSVLREEAAKGNLELHINSVIEGEVSSHIEKNIKKGVAELRKAVTQRSLAAFRNMPGYQEKLDVPDVSQWTDKIKKEFELFLEDCKVKRLPLNGVDVEEIVENYFQKKPPFEEKKPEEFKDALAVASIIKEVQLSSKDNSIYCVVSNDNGFRKAVEMYAQSNNLRQFKELKEFIDYLARLDLKVKEIKKYLQSKETKWFFDNILQEILEETPKDIETAIYGVEECEILNVENIEVTPYIIKTVRNNNTVTVLLDNECEIETVYQYTDPDRLFYNEQGVTYCWEKLVKMKEKYKVDFEITVSFDISELSINANEKKNGIKLKNIENAPNKIEFKERNIIESEEISDYYYNAYEIEERNRFREYNTRNCLSCGCILNGINDAGDGLCRKCSPYY